MSEGNNKITTRNIPVTNNKILVLTGSLMQPALLREIPTTNYKFLIHAGTVSRDSATFIMDRNMKQVAEAYFGSFEISVMKPFVNIFNN